MSQASGFFGMAVVGALVLAPLTRPTEADFEAQVSRTVSSYQDKQRQEGSIFRWIFSKGADLTRTGRYSQGLLTSEYTVYVAGMKIAECTGMLTMVYCSGAR